MAHTGRHGGRRHNAGRKRGEETRVIRLPAKLAAVVQRGSRPGDVAAFLDIEARTAQTVPLMSSKAVCGFPSPADDYLDRPIDFNELIVANPPATFAVRVAGESMTGAGIYPNDIAVIDCSRSPTHGCIVLACLDGEFTIKRYLIGAGVVTLRAENPDFPDITVSEGRDFEVRGVVTTSIRRF